MLSARIKNFTEGLGKIKKVKSKEKQNCWRERMPSVIMWAIAGLILLAGIVSGVFLFVAILLAGNPAIAFLTGASAVIFGFFIACVFVAVWKNVADMILGYRLVSDYRRRKKDD